MVKNTKLYDVLEISPDATEKEIMKAYYKLSKIWHPDRNPTRIEEATAKFQEISNAKDILSDPEKKEKYDRFGIMNDNDGPGPNFNPEDLLGKMFGMGGMHMPGMQMPGMPGMPNMFRRNQSEDCIAECIVTLEDLYNRKTVKVSYSHKVYCQTCNGTGSKDGKSYSCTGCQGKGQKARVIQNGPLRQHIIGPCEDCRGSGEKVGGNNK